MSIDVRKPPEEFYSELDQVVEYFDKAGTQLRRGRQAYDNAVKIAKNQGFNNLEITLLAKEYLKDKVPKTSLWRYLKELKPTVPMEQIYYNNVIEQKDIQQEQKHGTRNYQYEDMILDRVEGFDSTEKYILDVARLFRKTGYTEDKIFSETKRMCKSGGMGPAELDYVDVVLHWKYDTYRKFDEWPGKKPWGPILQYLKIAATLDMYGIPRDKISAKIKEIAVPIEGMEESYFIDWALQKTPYADPSIAQMDYLALWVKSILPRKYGGHIPDDRYEAEKAEKEIGIGDGRKHKADEKYCRHCIMK
jgi:hypothetical protein